MVSETLGERNAGTIQTPYSDIWPVNQKDRARRISSCALSVWKANGSVTFRQGCNAWLVTAWSNKWCLVVKTKYHIPRRCKSMTPLSNYFIIKVQSLIMIDNINNLWHEYGSFHTQQYYLFVENITIYRNL